MKIKGKTKVNALSALSMVSALTSSMVYAGAMGPVAVEEPGRIYASVFGGGGASNKVGISQFGTAYFLEVAGGPLAVNAFGTSNSRSMGYVGGHVGYQWPQILSNFQWGGLVPAVELEGYYLGNSPFTGHDVNNNTVRLDEHDFLVTYPMDAGVFLSNAVLNLNLSNYSRVHPFVGAGIGAAAISISNASSIQVSPAEAINHYNSKSSDNEAAFAAQVKAGLNFDLSKNFSVFAEYRWLYLSSTSYTFGSTVAPDHAETSSWLVKLNSQNYNMGGVGIRYSV